MSGCERISYVVVGYYGGCLRSGRLNGYREIT